VVVKSPDTRAAVPHFVRFFAVSPLTARVVLELLPTEGIQITVKPAVSEVTAGERVTVCAFAVPPPVPTRTLETVVAESGVTFDCTKAVVASLVELSVLVCVVAVVPFGSAGVPERFAAVPVVL
jgi:hypothetical protein